MFIRIARPDVTEQHAALRHYPVMGSVVHLDTQVERTFEREWIQQWQGCFTNERKGIMEGEEKFTRKTAITMQRNPDKDEKIATFYGVKGYLQRKYRKIFKRQRNGVDTTRN